MKVVATLLVGAGLFLVHPGFAQMGSPGARPAAGDACGCWAACSEI